MQGITQKEFESIKSNLRRYEEIDLKIDETAKRFLKVMAESNHELIINHTTSIGYNKVYKILVNNMENFGNQCITDYSCFYNKKVVHDIVNELVGTEKLQKMLIKILVIRDLLLKANALKNKMREKVENDINCEEAEELLDAIESLSVDNNISILYVRQKIEILEKKLLKSERVA